MGLSSNTILHQTTKVGLEGILTLKGFQLFYCKEFLKSSYLTPRAAFPMVCFSDIQISGLHKHLKRYHNYTIGMKKDWAKRNKLNPVLYFEENSTFAARLVENFDFALQKHFLNKNDVEAKELFYFFVHLLAFAKNYEGELNTAKVNDPNYRFSDEREWRYVPLVAEVGIECFYKHYDDYEANKNTYNEEISKYSLPFELTDINYIIVETPDEKNYFDNLLQKIFADEIKQKNISRMPISFFTNDQIHSDFL